MWDDIRTWIEGSRLFVFPELAVGIPNNEDYWKWKVLDGS